MAELEEGVGRMFMLILLLLFLLLPVRVLEFRLWFLVMGMRLGGWL